MTKVIIIIMRALFVIYILANSFGTEARTLLENHHRLRVESGYGRVAHLPPPSPSSSPPSREVSTDDPKSSKNSELLIMTTSTQVENNPTSLKKLFVLYLLPVSYVWNLETTISSFNNRLYGEKFYWRPKPAGSPPSPRPSDHQGQIIISSNFDNIIGREEKTLPPPAPKYNPPIHQVTSRAAKDF